VSVSDESVRTAAYRAGFDQYRADAGPMYAFDISPGNGTRYQVYCAAMTNITHPPELVTVVRYGGSIVLPLEMVDRQILVPSWLAGKLSTTLHDAEVIAEVMFGFVDSLTRV
jgi:hypothetical protein